MKLPHLIEFLEVLLKWPVLKGSSFVMRMMDILERNLTGCPSMELAVGFWWESRSYYTGF